MRDAKIYQVDFFFPTKIFIYFHQIYEGTAQIQRIIIAREWLGLAKQRGLLG